MPFSFWYRVSECSYIANNVFQWRLNTRILLLKCACFGPCFSWLLKNLSSHPIILHILFSFSDLYVLHTNLFPKYWALCEAQSHLGPIPESISWDARNCSNLRLNLLWWWRMKKQDTGTEMLRLGKLCSLIGTYHPFSKSTHGAGEMAQCLRAPTALLKVLSSNPCNHMLAYNHL